MWYDNNWLINEFKCFNCFMVHATDMLIFVFVGNVMFKNKVNIIE